MTFRFSSAWLVLGLGFFLGAITWGPVRRHGSAAELLLDLSAPPSPPRGQGTEVIAVDWPVRTGGLPVPGRLYRSSRRAHRCLVVGHGVHHAGIEEPRLVRFATELASAGNVVLTPELSELAGYRITLDGAGVLARAVRSLSDRCPAGERVGLIGFSFAGGLALVAATDPGTSSRLAYVTSVGGYHDLARVLRFFLDGRVEAPGGARPRAPHEYGLVVLAYGYLDHLVPEIDRPAAAAAVRAWLEEDRARAFAHASRFTTMEAERLLFLIAKGRLAELREPLRAILESHAGELRALSPSGRLASIPVPVFLLHGLGDSVIPPEETEWADRELLGRSHDALITPLIEHVEVQGKPKWTDQLALVRFVAGWL